MVTKTKWTAIDIISKLILFNILGLNQKLNLLVENAAALDAGQVVSANSHQSVLASRRSFFSASHRSLFPSHRSLFPSHRPLPPSRGLLHLSHGPLAASHRPFLASRGDSRRQENSRRNWETAPPAQFWRHVCLSVCVWVWVWLRVDVCESVSVCVWVWLGVTVRWCVWGCVCVCVCFCVCPVEIGKYF